MNIIFELPILYINTDKKRFWQIWITQESENKYYIVRKYGIINGTITNPQPKHIEDLNKAITKVKALWLKKKESGFSENKNNISIKSNFIKPMGAHKLDDHYHKIIYIAYVQKKLDGFRCLTHIFNKNVIMYSKGMKPFIFLNHIKKEINKIKELAYNSTIYLDGELYEKHLDLHQISSLVMKKYASNEHEENMKQISYYIFDMFDLNNMDRTFDERYNILLSIFKKYKFKYLKLVTCNEVKSFDEIKKLNEKYIYEGYEGIIVRNKNGLYKLNAKSYDVLRTKEFKKKDFIIIGAKQGTGTQQGAIIWNLQCLNSKNKNKNFWAIPIGTIHDRINIYNKYILNPQLFIGKKAKVKFLEITNDGCVSRNPIVEKII
jgi:ATP-dependent DNA ligase